jgi:uncharacterized repeat protein (TIGR01451 family)
MVTLEGTDSCTGTLLNDIPRDFVPYFLTANHCIVNNVDSSHDVSDVAASVVVYWNFQSPTCGTHGPGDLTQNQMGSTLVANYEPSDFALLKLNDMPDSNFNVFYAGWDASGMTPTATVGIHQPQGDVKAISFSNTQPDTMDNYLWGVVWDSGIVEPGSSGSCLFETTNGRCIGQARGPGSTCDKNERVLYGRFNVSWGLGPTKAMRLKDWLDPDNTGTLFNDGDPHITTASGIHYNFQSAGEFVSLRDPSGLEIQTRQAPIATTFNPGPDPYDAVATCVSLNTAVAARVGQHRVTYEPNLSGVPDPSGLQLRVDGVLASLGTRDLGDGARIAKTSAPGGLEIDFPDNTVLFATPGWWASQSKWYLNLDVVRGPATDGTSGDGTVGAAAAKVFSSNPSTSGLMGAIPPGSWLPVLPDGTSLGSMPDSVHQRYVDLYQTFGEAWRVSFGPSGSTSLFDYAPGTSTDTFTLRGWPPENPPCTIAGMIPVQPADPAVAEQACRPVTGTNRHADCVFDVIVTGEPGFAKTYLASQQAVEPPMIMTKAFGTPTIALGQTSSLTFTITNPNPTALTGVGFTDTLPVQIQVATLNHLSNPCGGTVTATPGGNTVTLTGVTVAAGSSCILSLDVVGVQAGTGTNSVTVLFMNDVSGNTSIAIITVVAPPVILKTFGAPSISLNGTTSLTFAITNPASNTVALTGVTFMDMLPSGLQVANPNNLSNTCGGTAMAMPGSRSVSLANGNVAEMGSIQAGNSMCTVSLNVTGTAVGLQNNAVQVTSTNGGTGNTAMASTTVTTQGVLPPIITKAFGDSEVLLFFGSTALSFTLTNPNTVPLTGLAFTDTLPYGLLVSTPNGLTGSCGGGIITAIAGSNSISLSSATLAPGASCAFSVNVTGTATGVQTNTTSTVTSNGIAR